VGRTAKYRSSDALLVDLFFLTKAVPPKVEQLGEWIADLQSMYAQYQKALRREKRRAKS